MPSRAFLDSNVCIFGFERRASNSHRILEMLAEGGLRGVVTDRVVREVLGYLRRHYGKDATGKFRDFILLTCDLILEADLHVRPGYVEAVGRKDAGALAAVRELGISRLVSTDSDFDRVPEHRSPRAFLVEAGERPRSGEE